MLCHSDPDTVIVTCYPATHRPRAHHPPQSGCLDHKWPPFLVVLISTTGHYWVCDYVTLTSLHPIFPNKITQYERRPAAVAGSVLVRRRKQQVMDLFSTQASNNLLQPCPAVRCEYQVWTQTQSPCGTHITKQFYRYNLEVSPAEIQSIIHVPCSATDWILFYKASL